MSYLIGVGDMKRNDSREPEKLTHRHPRSESKIEHGIFPFINKSLSRNRPSHLNHNDYNEDFPNDNADNGSYNLNISSEIKSKELMQRKEGSSSLLGKLHVFGNDFRQSIMERITIREPMFRLRSTWNVAFGTAVKLLRTAAYSLPRDVKSIRLLTDHDIPTWLPILPSGVTTCSSQHPPGEWFYESSAKQRMVDHEGIFILYFHGGAFCLCNTGTHRDILYRIVKATSACLLAADYRRPPEHSFPIPVDDCLLAYEHLLQSVDASRIILMGDSAGGTLVLSTMLRAKERGLPLPAAGVLLSPWVDLSNTSSPSWNENIKFDFLPRDLAQLFGEAYRGSSSWEEVCPSYATNLNELPPLLVECGECEVLRDQIETFCSLCQSQGVDVTLNLRQDMVHMFQLFAVTGMTQIQESLEAIGAFCAQFIPPSNETISR
eukprot:gene5162-10322_t